MPPRFPVFWLTVLALGFVAAATRDVLIGGFFFVAVLPAVLLGQWLIRALFQRFRSRIWLRRAAMLLPALVIAFGLFRATNRLGNQQIRAVRIALAGQVPTGIRELHVQEDAWTDYVVFAYFRSDPTTLKRILERPPFVHSHFQPGTYSFAECPFPDLRALPDAQSVVVFRRTDLEQAKGSCDVYTDSVFSFAYIQYGVD